MRTSETVQPGPIVQVRRLDPTIAVPAYALEGDAGADLCTTEDFELAPGQRRLVPTGIAIACPSGFVGLVHPRSGLAVRHGITVVNAPGTIDSGYRGEIKVTLLNTDTEHSVAFARGDRIAQLLIQRVEHARFVEVDGLDRTVRGERGFGSTGGFGTGQDPAGAAR